MSRKDTIIIAALINSALLAVLFMMAARTDVDQGGSVDLAREEYPLVAEEKQQDVNEIAYAHVATRDEIDKVLQDYSLSENRREVEHREADHKESGDVEKSVDGGGGSFAEVTVKRGDYLEKIARSYGTTVSAIMRENNLRSPRIDIGQTLRIPLEEKKSSQESQVRYYTMKVGDNPWKIAKQFDVRFDELLKLNDLDEARARNLKPGDKIRVR